MRKWLLASTAIVAFTAGAERAEADPVTYALIQSGVSFWGAVSATYGVVAAAALQIGASMLLTAAVNSLSSSKVSAPKIKREFQLPDSRPTKRYVYGHYRMTPSPIPWRVSGNVLIGCLLLNSRPSAGTNLTVFIDGKECSVVRGSFFDFEDQDGAVLHPEGFYKFEDDDDGTFISAWLGLGDQVAPPAYVTDNFPSLFLTSDAWRGMTVLWVKFRAGSAGKQAKRWRNVPPTVEVQMDYSQVWDPRDVAQDPDNPATWTFSANQSLCLLDALTQNPLRRYKRSQLLLETFIDGADVADEPVICHYATLAAGADVYEPRYAVGGFINWSGGELSGLVQPIADAGAGRIIRMGGQLGYAPGAWEAPVYTAHDIVGDSVSFEVDQPSRNLAAALKVGYVSAERNFEDAETPLWPIPGGPAQVNDDNVNETTISFCNSPTQAQRIAKIEALRLGAQKRLSCTFPPSGMVVVPGSIVATDFAAPLTRMNGTWRAQGASPAIWLAEEGGVALRVPVTLAEESSAIYDWTPASDEKQIATADLSMSYEGPAAISDLVVEPVEVDSGGSVVLMLRYSFTPVSNVPIDHYELQFKLGADADYTPLPNRAPDVLSASGKIEGTFGPVEFGASYDFRALPVGFSDEGFWAYALGVGAGLQASGVSASAGPARLQVSGTAPSDGYLAGMRLYRAPVGGVFNDAVQVGKDIPVAPDAAFSIVFGDPEAVDLVSNGDFADGSGWMLGGGWSIAGGVASHDGASSGGTLGQASGALVAGAQYRLSAHVTAISGAGAAACQLVGDTVVSGDLFTSTGRKVSTVTAPTSPATLRLVAATNQLLSVNTFSVVAQTPDALPAGEGRFWLVPYTASGANGTPTALGTFTIT
ncbi:hypothetical protein PVT71_18255 [Salipiger sp. H15]|uniref:Tip attachment protein J domain-containing protein n=1 Tax=Alloyangia sp. H15 TaxID=3029062 RepID=A0AAU8AP99_9RHOB